MDTVTAIELTDEQETAANHAGGHVAIRGVAGTGKTTTLLARYVALLDDHSPSELLVVCRSGVAADAFRDAVLAHVAGGFDSLPITTFAGFAFDISFRYASPVETLTREEQVEEVARLLEGEGQAEWPTLHRYLRRRAFAEQVAGALVELDTNLVSADDVGGRSAGWDEVGAFATRYRDALDAAHMIDFPGLAARATRLLDDPAVRSAKEGRYRHVLVDDFETATVVGTRLVHQLLELGATVTVAGDAIEVAGIGPALDIELTRRFRRPAPPRLVVCNHPALEAEAIAGELLAARAEGIGWAEMAVLTRSSGSRAGAIARALARHGIPVDGAPGSDDEPLVRAVVDVLLWVGGDAGALDRVLVSPVSGLEPSTAQAIRRRSLRDGTPLADDPRLAELVALRDDLAAKAATASPADLAFEVWHRTLGHLATDGDGDGRTLDAIYAFITRLQRRAARRPRERLADLLAHDGDWPSHGSSPGPARGAGPAVTLSSIAAAAGREWHTVVIAGCVEGELPRLRAYPALFDPWLLRAGDAPDALERRHLLLEDEKRLFQSACARATGQVIGTVAADPGVLLSRFVESWDTSEPRLVTPPGRATAHLSPTTGTAPVCPDGHLQLSATRLSTYDDCPLRYAYEYVLGARSEVGVYAALGTLVHAVLAEFLDPENPASGDLSRDRLLKIADDHWRDDIAPYRPQVEEIRRDYFSMLQSWWQVEVGDSLLGPIVIDTEHEFAIDVGPHTLTGSIDRIDRFDDRAGIRVVDYKTGRTKPNAAQVADNIQLAVYYLAASRDPSLASFGPPTELRLLYLRDLKAYEQKVTPDHAATTEERVLVTAGRILDEDFAPSIDADCRTCSYHRLCPLQDEGRQVTG